MNDQASTSHVVNNNSISAALGRILRSLARTLVMILPPGAPIFIYTKLLAPRPLRALGNLLLKKMIPTEIAIPEGTLYLNQNDAVVSGALTLGAYEPYFANVLRDSLTSDMIMADVGANLGYYTLIGSAHVSHVLAFEPETTNAAFLSKTVKKNERKNVTLVQKGLGEAVETRSLQLHPDNEGKHTLLEADWKNPTSVPITLTTLDNVVDELRIPHIDLIKMDIEGWEAKALRGAARTIQAHHPVIFFEFAPMRIKSAGDDPKHMLRELKAEGYTLFIIDEDRTALLPLDPDKLLETLLDEDSYVNILARPSAQP